MYEIDSLLTESIDPEEIFELLQVLGQGAYGSVSKALHKQTGQLYAIKILPATNLQEINSIKKQISILSDCDDDHIVKYYGSYFKDNNLWIVMEYCVAGSITDIMHITDKKLNQNEIASILESVLKALVYLHQRKKIHRDIKAANILLDQKGYAKLTDFGVSAESKYTNDRHKTHIGSPYWMSPQMLRYSEYTHTTDIWSLGITAIELAEGSVPYSDVKPYRAMWKMKQKPIQSFEKPQLWSPQFNSFISDCLQFNLNNRPQAKELLNHPFITLKSRGQRLLAELVLNSLEEIQQFRRGQSHNSSFAEIVIDGGSLNNMTVVNRTHGKASFRLLQDDSINNSMVVKEDNQILNNSMVINHVDAQNPTSHLNQYIHQLKNIDSVQEERKDQLLKKLKSYDQECIKQIAGIYNKYKQNATTDYEKLHLISNKNIPKCSLIQTKSLALFLSSMITQLKVLTKIDEITGKKNTSCQVNRSISLTKDNKSLEKLGIKKMIQKDQREKERQNVKLDSIKQKNLKQFVDDPIVLEYLKKSINMQNAQKKHIKVVQTADRNNLNETNFNTNIYNNEPNNSLKIHTIKDGKKNSNIQASINSCGQTGKSKQKNKVGSYRNKKL